MKKFIGPTFIFTTLVMCLSLIIGVQAGAPIAENLEITTYRNTSVGGRLGATDPDGDIVAFEITTQPNKGTVEIEADGCFVYTPFEGKKGKDYFGYRVIDAEGNVSQEGTVIIRIEKQKTKTTYSDMVGNGSAYAATALAERGIFVGETLAGTSVFSPERSVTRAEFLAMCMEISDIDLLTGVSRTGFFDDVDIPVWAKPYVSTALKCGIVSGYAISETGAVFGAGSYITASEAAVILNRVTDLTDVSYIAAEAVPVWAAQATANLSACNILTTGVTVYDEVLTRAQAAEMVIGALEVIEAR